MIRRFFTTVALGSLFVGGLAASHLAFAEPGGPGGPRGGGMMAMLDANKDGTVTRAELAAALDARFARMDVDRDGKLTPADRAAMHAQRLDARFATLDADKSGQISKAEFTAAAEARREKWAGRKGPDGAGPEGRRGPGGHSFGGRHHGGRGGMMFGPGPKDAGRDADKDGTVTKAEFMARPIAMFDKADANHDGKVTADEMKVAREAMRGEMRGKWQDRKGPTPPPAG